MVATARDARASGVLDGMKFSNHASAEKPANRIIGSMITPEPRMALWHAAIGGASVSAHAQKRPDGPSGLGRI